MAAVIGVLTVIVLVVGAVIAAVIWYMRQTAREKKNYERALKTVTLMIHLPPASEDIEATGRDVRDIVDENISKAQVIYSIVASTIQKGNKSRLYGQRHFSFEIVGSQGLVYFYAMVPMALVDVVKQAIISAYTSAQVEEVVEHNIFNKSGKLSGVLGGEFVLKKPFAYPIATYQEIKRDTMQALLNALSTLDKEDGASIQILMRPSDRKWQQEATSVANDKRNGKSKKSGMQSALNIGKQFVVALAKPPETGNDKKDQKELSNLERSIVDAIDDKTRYQGYEVLIRVVVSSNITQRSQAILANIVASFSLFDAPGKNGFKYVAAENTVELVRDYVLRLFPQSNRDMVLNAVELSTLFHFPDQRSIPTSQLRRQESKQVDAPRNMPTDGLLLGYNLFRGVKKPIRLSLQDRQRHMYVVGQTGTGKSTFLENLALQDMLNGDGFAFVDPHGDTVERLLSMVPKERTEDIIYFSPADMAYPMGLNIFEFDTPDQKDFLIQEALNMLYKLYDPQHTGIMGPRYEHLFRNAALTVMADPEGGTFVDIPKLFRDPKYVQQKLKYVTDPNVREFWEREMPQAQRSNEYGDVVSWFVSKFGAFLSNEMMRNIIGQTKSAFNLREIMDKKKILLVNLSKGRTGQLNMQLLGIIFVMKFQAAAMSRASIPEKERTDFALYVDEFQNFSTDSFATILSEARKYHLNLIAANQFTTQLSEAIRDAVFGNVGTTIAFRVGDRDAEALKKYFQPSFDETDILRVPNYNAIVRTMVGGVPTLPFSMATLPPLGTPNMRLAEALKQLSAAKYGRPKVVVEEEIFARMATKTDSNPKPDFGQLGTAQGAWGSNTPRSLNPPSFTSPAGQFSSYGSGPAGMSSPTGDMKKQPSFLDEWLAKRQGISSGAASRPQNSPSSIPMDVPSFDSNPGGFPHVRTAGIPTNPFATEDRTGVPNSNSEVSQQGTFKVNAEPLSGTPQSSGNAPNSTDSISIDNEGTLRIR
jgi:hypothetical protein